MTQKTHRMTAVFDYADHVIRLEVCLFSGREWLYLDEQLLEKKWNLTSCNSRFYFVLDGKKAEVRLQAKGWRGVLRGAYDVHLLVDEQQVDSDQFDYMTMLQTTGPQRKLALQQMLMYAAAGFAFGFALVWLIKH